MTSPSASADAGRLAWGVRLAFAATALAALHAGPWLWLAPNRLLPGEPIGALQALGWGAHVLTGLTLLALAALPRRPLAALACVCAAIAAALVLTGLAATALMVDRPPAARAGLGGGLWLALAAWTLLATEAAREAPRTAAKAVAPLMALAAVAAAAWLGSFDALSLMVEWRARSEALTAAFVQHLALAAASLALALAGSAPLGWLAFRRPRLDAAVTALVGGVQIIPALALFGLLIPLLALALNAAPALRAWGIAAIGPAPAIIGVAAYLALPLVSAMVSGLRAASPAIVEAARAMGFSEERIAREIRLPLALPVFLGGLRVAAVQAVGLATLGGLIGAGGLGAVVFEGMAQFAEDLILLAAAPIVALAAALDAALSRAERGLRARLA